MVNLSVTQCMTQYCISWVAVVVDAAPRAAGGARLPCRRAQNKSAGWRHGQYGYRGGTSWPCSAAVGICSTLLTVKRTILACAPSYLYKLAIPTRLAVCTGGVHVDLSIMHNDNISSRHLPLKVAKKAIKCYRCVTNGHFRCANTTHGLKSGKL